MSYASKISSEDTSKRLFDLGWVPLTKDDEKTQIFFKPKTSYALVMSGGVAYDAVQISGSLDHKCGSPVFQAHTPKGEIIVSLDKSGGVYLHTKDDQGTETVSRASLQYVEKNEGQIFDDHTLLLMALSGLTDPLEALEARMPDSIRNDTEFVGVPHISGGQKIPKKVIPVYNEKGELFDVKKKY